MGAGGVIKVLVKDLDTLRRLYEPDGKTPEMLAESSGPIAKGQEVIAHDGKGNSVRCTARRQMIAVVPDWETYNEGVSKNQEAML